MTREKAIWWVNHLFEIRKEEYFNKGIMEDAKEVEEAQHMAIEALSATSCHQTEDNSDLISRTKVRKVIQSAYDGEIPYTLVKDIINSLPSARPTGEWEHLSIKSISRSGVDELQELQCSNCGKWVTTPYMYYPSYHKFCPCCGAMMSNSNEGVDMRGGDDE